MRRSKPHKRILWLVAFLLLLGGSLLTLDLARLWAKSHLTAFTHHIRATAQVLERAEENPSTAVPQAQRHLSAARAELEAMRPVAGPAVTLAGSLAHLPWIGPPAATVVDLWEFADEATHAGQTLLNVAHFGLANLEQESLSGLITAMPELKAQLQVAESSFARAQMARDRLRPVAWLPAEQETALETALARWDRFAPQVETVLSKANRLVWILSALLEHDRPMTYLLIVQSSDNLRATGGFLTGVGTIRLEQGKITAISISEVTEVEERRQWSRADWELGVSGAGIIPPPEPVTRYMGLGHWVLRDANWWADFPATARQVAAFWQMVHDTPVDGVIAINDQAVEALLKAVGPVRINEDEVVSTDTLRQISVSRIYHGDKGGHIDQSFYFQELSVALMTLSQSLSPERLLQLSTYLETQTTRHDLMITSFDPEINAVLHLLGIDGALQGQQDDYLYVVEDDMSDTKLNPFIKRDLAYEVLLGPGGRPLLSTLIINVANTYVPGSPGLDYPAGYYDGSRWNPITRRMDSWPGYYGGYVRIFLPDGSRFLDAVGLDDEPDVGAESGRTVIGGYVGLHPGDQRQLRWQWIPAVRPSAPNRYRLLVQRQPGAPPRPLTVTVRLVTDYQVAAALPPPARLSEQTVTRQTSLDQDLDFTLKFTGEGQLLTAPPFELTAAISSVLSSLSTTAVTTTTAAPQATPRAVAPAPPPPPGRTARPVWINIPAIAVNAPVVPVGLEPSGIMASPSEADIVGWYELGPRPGESSNAILAGHIDWRGEVGAFARLHELQAGDVIEVQSGPQTGFRYVVESAKTYRADTAPVAEIFGETAEPVLTLITCGGPYDATRQEYRDRLVIRAVGQ